MAAKIEIWRWGKISFADGLSESDLIFLQAQWSEVIEGSVWKWYEVCTVSVSDLSLYPFLYEGTAVPFNYIRQIDTSSSLNVLLLTFLWLTSGLVWLAAMTHLRIGSDWQLWLSSGLVWLASMTHLRIGSDWQLWLTSGLVWLAAMTLLRIDLIGSYDSPLGWSDWLLWLTSGLVWLAAVLHLTTSSSSCLTSMACF